MKDIMATLRIIIFPLLFVILCVKALDFNKDVNALPDDQFIVKPNYGTMFERIARMQLTTSNWYHTIAIKLPGELPVLSHNLSVCDEQSDLESFLSDENVDSVPCAIMGRLFRMSHMMANRLLDVARRQNETLQYLLSQPSKRSKRGLFNFIGKMRSFFEGVATEDEIQTFQDNMDLIETRINDISGVLMKGNEELVSYRTTIDTRLNNVWTAINETADMLEAVSNQMNYLTQRFNTGFAELIFKQRRHQMELAHEILYDSYMHAFNIRNLHTLQMVISELDSFIMALGKLNEGYLSPYLVSTSDLQLLIDYVSDTLRAKYPSYVLTHTRPENYYEIKDVISVRSGQYLFIQLRMPLQDVNMHYTLYSVKTIPLSLHSKTSSRTLIDTAPYLGISLNQKYYIQPTTAELNMCYGQYFKTCPAMILSTTLSQWSCTSAILFDQTHLISKLCNIQIILPTSNLYTHILDYGNTSLFISTNDLSWSEACFTNVPHNIPSCNMCTITRKCRCSVYGQSFYLAPDIRTCKNASVKSISYFHHFNLAPLLNVMDEDWHKVLNLSGNLTGVKPVEVPSIEILELDKQLSKISHLGGTDAKYHLSLNESLQRLKDNVDLISQPIHLKHLPFWANSNNNIYSGFFGSCFVLMTVFSFLVTSCICLQYCKGKVGPALIASSQFPLMARGLNLDHNDILKGEVTERLTEDLMLNEISRIVKSLNLVTYCVIVSLVLLVCFVIFKVWQRYLKWFCTCSQRQPVTASTMIHFVIWDGELNTVSFPICRIPSSYRHISAIDNKLDIDAHVSWYACMPFFSWNPRTLVIKIHDNDNPISLPDHIRLDPFLAWRISRLFLKSHTIQFVLQDNSFTHCLVRRFNDEDKNIKKVKEYKFLGIKPNLAQEEQV